MKKNPILMKVAKGSAMQMNYGSPAKKTNLEKLGTNVVNRVKDGVKNKAKEISGNIKKGITNVKNFFNTDND